MKAWKIAAAILLTCIFIIVSESVHKIHNESRIIESSNAGFLMQHKVQPVHRGQEFPPKLVVRITTSLQSHLYKVFLMSKPAIEPDTGAEYVATEARLADGAIDDYEVTMQQYPVGSTVSYYFKVEGINGTVFVTLPTYAETDSTDVLSITFEDYAPIWLVILQKMSRGATILTVMLAFFACFEIVRRPESLSLVGKQSFWAAIFLLGNVVFSALLQLRTDGPHGWGGWPFGAFDFTDTLLEVTVIIWIIITILLKGSVFSGIPAGNLVSSRAARAGIIASSILTIGVIMLHAAS